MALEKGFIITTKRFSGNTFTLLGVHTISGTVPTLCDHEGAGPRLSQQQQNRPKDRKGLLQLYH